MTTTHSELFSVSRERLWSIAYRMLGSRADADDAVQDAWMRWQQAPLGDIRSPEAWLVTTTTRICIDRLRHLRSERERYTGPWLPEPIVDESASAERAAELASELSVALLALLERLAPEERAAFLLREIFESDYGDIAQILGKSEAACRQIVSRASKRVREQRPRVEVPESARRRVRDGFIAAVQSQDQQALLKLLAPECSWTSDGGGKARAALRVLHGAQKVSRFGANVFRKFIHQMEFRPVVVNGEPGCAVISQRRLFSVMTLRTDGERILDVYVVMNPDKLRAVRIAIRP